MASMFEKAIGFGCCCLQGEARYSQRAPFTL